MTARVTIYHVNPETGDPNACRAKGGNCPFKGHNTDPEACRRVYEKAMTGFLFVTYSKASGKLYNDRKPKFAL